jgi:hypothetical protein
MVVWVEVVDCVSVVCGGALFVEGFRGATRVAAEENTDAIPRKLMEEVVCGSEGLVVTASLFAFAILRYSEN